MDTRLTWFITGAASTALLLSVTWYFVSPNNDLERGKASEDFYNSFAIHGPLESDWSRVHQFGELDVWGDDAKTSLAITRNGRAVQLLTSDSGCCTFDIFEQGEYKATVKYGNYDQRLLTQGADQRGEIWTYVDMGINGTIDFRYKDGISNSMQQVVMTQFAGDDGSNEQFSTVSNSGW